MQAQEEVIMIKGRRGKRPRLALTMATSSSSTAEPSGGGGFNGGVISGVVSVNSDRVTPSPSNSGDLTQSTVEEEEDMANCLILLAKGSLHTAAPQLAAAAVEVYQCKTCNKSFPSFQALGGHRASHRKPNNKPILTVEDKKALMREKKQEDFQSNGRDDSTILSLQISNKSRVHECSICGAKFASGQALGGHMRRHKPIPAAVAAPSSGHGEFQEVKRPRNILSLDLNLPAPEDDHTESNKFPFAAKEQVIVFSASPLVDCHY